MLLDPHDTAAVDEYLKGEVDIRKGQHGGNESSSRPSKSCKKFNTPTSQSGGTVHILLAGKSQNANFHHCTCDD